MDQLYERINSHSNAHRQRRDQVASLYQSLRSLGYRDALPEAPHRPPNAAIWPIFNFLQYEITGKQLSTQDPRVGSALETVGYPHYTRLDGREREPMDSLWPDLLDSMLYMCSILDFKVTQKEYKDEFPKLGAMQIDAILCEYQALADPIKRASIRASYDKKLNEYADYINSAIDDTRQDIEVLEADTYQKQKEPEIRARIKQQSEALQLDKHHLEVYMEKSTANLSHVEKQLDQCDRQLAAALDQQTDLEIERGRLEAIMERQGKSLGDVLQETNRVKSLEADLKDAQASVKEAKASVQASKCRFSENSLPLQDRFRELNKRYHTQLPTEISWDDLPDPSLVTSIEDKLRGDTQDLELKILDLETSNVKTERDTEASVRKEETIRSKQYRLDKEFENQKKALEALAKSNISTEEKAYSLVQAQVEARRAEYDAANEVRHNTEIQLGAAKQEGKELDAQMSGYLKPLYDRVDQKQNQLRNVYSTMSLSVNTLQGYAQEYVGVCEKVSEQAKEIKVQKPTAVHLNVDYLLEGIKRARTT